MIFLTADTKIKRQVSFEFSEKKKLLPVRFSVKFVMLPAQSIALAKWFACVCLYERDRAGLIDKPDNKIFL